MTRSRVGKQHQTASWRFRREPKERESFASTAFAKSSSPGSDVSPSCMREVAAGDKLGDECKRLRPNHDSVSLTREPAYLIAPAAKMTIKTTSNPIPAATTTPRRARLLAQCGNAFRASGFRTK